MSENEYMEHLVAWYDLLDAKSTSPVRTLAIMALVKEQQETNKLLRIIAEALIVPDYPPDV